MSKQITITVPTINIKNVKNQTVVGIKSVSDSINSGAKAIVRKSFKVSFATVKTGVNIAGFIVRNMGNILLGAIIGYFVMLAFLLLAVGLWFDAIVCLAIALYWYNLDSIITRMYTPIFIR